MRAYPAATPWTGLMPPASPGPLLPTAGRGVEAGTKEEAQEAGVEAEVEVRAGAGAEVGQTVTGCDSAGAHQRALRLTRTSLRVGCLWAARKCLDQVPVAFG